MFTGIVQGMALVEQIEQEKDLSRLQLRMPEPLGGQVEIGASVAVNGTCLTVTQAHQGRLSFDVMVETLRVTNLGSLIVGAQVNVERAARFGDEIGGHLLSGHIHTQARIRQVEAPDNNRIIWFDVPAEWRRYLFSKGFVALNGCSLTIGEVDEQGFNVYLIPETLRQTTFGQLQKGETVNLEVDSQTQAIVDTLERIEKERDAKRQQAEC